ncbi:uncharacterized protein KY384_005425 [Bacidia gigantensis]|uniref:uncharacterized protein n=1 Tax=Bacidia gigantensis TaxID=2732470 RepID=UPI001D0511CD|nr:uncharacterized protein KY384_005425 [Bacidia gigantensis]KAG8529944.1 hypothetical protein KY384_005425 [Bacidia gigantensis]
MQDVKRLHVTPFNPELLPAVLPHKLQQNATEISFHFIESSPENNYGYLNLPSSEADQLRQKLHGCVLRGRKMKVEEAKPKKSSKGKKVEDRVPDLASKQTRSKNTTNKEDGTFPAVELPAKRKVKRGWTEADMAAKENKDKPRNDRKKPKEKGSSLTGKSECLFKTKMPVNAAPGAVGDGAKKRKLRNGQEVVVHEFQNTRQHAAFLKEDDDAINVRPAKEYVDGKGWVDENEDIVERARKRRRSRDSEVENDRNKHEFKKACEKLELTARAEEVPNNLEDEETSPDITSNSDSEATEDAGKDGQPPTRIEGLGISKVDDGDLQTARVDRLSISRSSGSPGLQVQTQATSVPSEEVHPLEALFKRPKAAASHAQTPRKPHLEVSTSFNFFEHDSAESGGGDASLLMPHTPFTQQDYRHRLIRSAAPTPDTALPGKTFGDVLAGRHEEDPESEGEDEEQATAGREAPGLGSPEGKAKAEEQPESEFAQWFWEHRGENNRAWKRRRREVAKERKTRDKNERKA